MTYGRRCQSYTRSEIWGQAGRERRADVAILSRKIIRTNGSRLFFFLIFICQCWVLSCSMWDLVPWPKTKPRPPAVGAWSLSWWTTREVPKIFFKIFNFSLSFDSHLLKFSLIYMCVCVCVYLYIYISIHKFIKKSSPLVNSCLLVLLDCSSQILSWINQIQERIWSNQISQILSSSSLGRCFLKEPQTQGL